MGARGALMLSLSLRPKPRLMLRLTTLSMVTTHPGTVATTDMGSSMARGALMLLLSLRPKPRLMLRPTTLSMVTTHPGTVATMALASSMARGALMLSLSLRPKPRLMLRLTTLSMDTTHPGTVATTATASSMARGALMLLLSQSLRPRPRLMLRLRLTMLFMATIPLDMLPTPTSTCTARGVLNPLLKLSPTCTATDLATPTGPTTATTMASRRVENRNRMLCLAALNKLV